MNTDVMFSSKRADWETPPELFMKYHRQYNYTIDVCANETNHKLPNWMGPFRYAVTGERGFTDGLAHTWTERCWCNPPYQDPEAACKPNCKKKKCQERGHHVTEYQPGTIDWVKKAYDSVFVQGTAELVTLLLPARTDTKWYHTYIWDDEIGWFRPGVIVDFLPGRVKFLVDGQTKDPAPFPSMVVTMLEPDEDVIL